MLDFCKPSRIVEILFIFFNFMHYADDSTRHAKDKYLDNWLSIYMNKNVHEVFRWLEIYSLLGTTVLLALPQNVFFSDCTLLRRMITLSMEISKKFDRVDPTDIVSCIHRNIMVGNHWLPTLSHSCVWENMLLENLGGFRASVWATTSQPYSHSTSHP